MATETLILRPSSFYKKMGTPSTVPSGTSDANYHTLVSDEVADDNATYISISSSTAFVILAFAPISVPGTITKISCVARWKGSSSTAAACIMSIAEPADTSSGFTDLDRVVNTNSTIGTTAYQTTVVECPNALEKAASNPGQIFLIRFAGSGKTTFTLTQVYLEIEYEAGGGESSGIHIKHDGAWAEASQMYHKVSGAWVEITAEECKSILQRNAITV